MSKIGKVYFENMLAGTIWEDENGYHFQYLADYLTLPNPQSVSLTLPLQNAVFHSKVLFPFFDGLIPEGWLLDIGIENWKLNPRNRMELLLTLCQDCIGAVHIISES